MKPSQQSTKRSGGPKQLAINISSCLSEVLLNAERPIALHEPEFDDVAEDLVVDCIRSTYVSSVGNNTRQFEEKIAEVCEVRHCVAIVNGTAALQLALRVVGVKPGSEVLMPSLTFVATANAVSHLGAVPHFVDVEERTLGIDPQALKKYLDSIACLDNGSLINTQTGREIRAIVPVHVFGHPVDMDMLKTVAEPLGLKVVEDAAESLGSSYKKKRCGGLGHIGAISFNGNKIITTGGGGALVTDNTDWADMARHLSTTAKQSHPWSFFHDDIGYNYRMPNLNAALGLAQVRQLENKLSKKRKLAEAYFAAFEGHPGIRVMREPAEARSNYWLNTLILEPHLARANDIVLKHLNEQGFMARPIWKPMHQLPMFSTCPRGELLKTESLADRIINIPSSAHLADLVA